MIQKFFLFITLVLSAISLFFITKISKKLSSQSIKSDTSALGELDKTVAETLAEPKQNEDTTSITLISEMPKIWSDLSDRNLTKGFVSFDEADKDQVKELIDIINQSNEFSIYSPEKTSSYSMIDAESKKALSTMDVFIIFYTGSYPKNKITNQEFGFATSRDIPVVLIVQSNEEAEMAKSYSNNIIILNPENKPKIATEIAGALYTVKDKV